MAVNYQDYLGNSPKDIVGTYAEALQEDKPAQPRPSQELIEQTLIGKIKNKMTPKLNDQERQLTSMIMQAPETLREEFKDIRDPRQVRRLKAAREAQLFNQLSTLKDQRKAREGSYADIIGSVALTYATETEQLQFAQSEAKRKLETIEKYLGLAMKVQDAERTTEEWENFTKPRNALTLQKEQLETQYLPEKLRLEQAQAKASLANTYSTINQRNAEIAKTQAEEEAFRIPELDNVDNGDIFKNAFGRATADSPGTQKKSDLETFRMILKSGDTAGAKEFILQRAAETSNADTYKQVIGRETTKSLLTGISDSLDEFIQKGGNTNLLTGSFEEITNKLGKTSNPELRKIETRIKTSLFEYRRAMTGVQFSPTESAQYEEIFPSFKNEPPLNQALIDGLIMSLDQNNESFFKQKIGSSNYEVLFKGGSATVTSTGNVDKDIEDDIKNEMQYYQTREQLIDSLFEAYGKEKTKDQIAKKVYQLIDDNNRVK